MRFFLDEDHSDAIAKIARRRGVDMTSSHEVGRDGWTDPLQLRQAGEEGRCVITRNYDYFTRFTREHEKQGIPHAGVLFVPDSLRSNHYAAIAEAIVRFDDQHPDGVPPYSIWWLSPERE
jgi:hypothetical protein